MVWISSSKQIAEPSAPHLWYESAAQTKWLNQVRLICGVNQQLKPNSWTKCTLVQLFGLSCWFTPQMRSTWFSHLVERLIYPTNEVHLVQLFAPHLSCWFSSSNPIAEPRAPHLWDKSAAQTKWLEQVRLICGVNQQLKPNELNQVHLICGMNQQLKPNSWTKCTSFELWISSSYHNSWTKVRLICGVNQQLKPNSWTMCASFDAADSAAQTK